MRLVVVHTSDAGKSIRAKLEELGACAYWYNGAEWYNGLVWSRGVEDSGHFDAIMLHWSNHDCLQGEAFKCIVKMPSLKIAFSSSEFSGVKVEDGWLRMDKALPGARAFADEDWKDFLNWMQKGGDHENLPYILQPSSISPSAVAVALMCDGFELTHTSVSELTAKGVPERAGKLLSTAEQRAWFEDPGNWMKILGGGFLERFNVEAEHMPFGNVAAEFIESLGTNTGVVLIDDVKRARNEIVKKLEIL